MPASLVAEVCKNKEVKQMIAFGDSELDTGNVYKYRTNRTYPPSPPYYKGSYSNGPVYIERVFYTLKKYYNCNRFRKLQNYAYGAATTDNKLVQGRTVDMIEVPSILQQVRHYIKNSKTSVVPQSQRLYFVQGGENNLFFNNSITNVVTVNSLIQSVKLLLFSGAKHVFVINFTPFQYLPAVVALGPQVQAFAANYFIEGKVISVIVIYMSILLFILTNLYFSFSSPSPTRIGNQLLLNATKNLAGVTLVDLYGIALNVINNPATYGFTDNSTACIQITNSPTVCSNPNQHIFWDSFHLTTGVYKILAQTIFDQIKDKI